MIKPITILGSEWDIIIKDYEDEPLFAEKSLDGWCNPYSKEMVVCNMYTMPGWKDKTEKDIDTYQKRVIRHEILHAFFDESGLSSSAVRINMPWPENEEMIDWFAIQGPKIFECWKMAECI